MQFQSLCSVAFTVTGSLSSKSWSCSLWIDTHLTVNSKNTEFLFQLMHQHPSMTASSPTLACCGSTGKLYYSENDLTDFLRFPWSPQSVASADCQNDRLFLGSCPYIHCHLTCHFTGPCNVLHGHDQSSPQGISVQRKDPVVP